MSFSPKVISRDEAESKRSCRATTGLGYTEMIEINRLSQAFFRIQSIETRQQIITLIEDTAAAERLDRAI
jgi:hypothetical protein